MRIRVLSLTVTVTSNVSRFVDLHQLRIPVLRSRDFFMDKGKGKGKGKGTGGVIW